MLDAARIGEPTVAGVGEWLGWPPDALGPLETLAALGPPPVPLTFPERGAARRLLAAADVPPHAITEMLGALQSAAAAPEAWWLLERLFHGVLHDTDAFAPPWPSPVPAEDPLSRYFHLYVFLAAMPHALRADARRGVPVDVTWDTLGDLGLQVAHFQARTGRPGFDGAFWMWQHFRGETYRLGRLQFDRAYVLFEPPASAAFARGDPALGVHIPVRGPLTEEACDASFARARPFFGRRFPDWSFGVATCTSWLMDEQLAEYLPETSNIVRFQRRFTVDGGWGRPGDEDVVRFVFGHLPDDLDTLPQRTTLERAVVRHLRDGRHWWIRQGWFRI